MKFRKTVIALCAGTLLVSGCATTEGGMNNKQQGALIGSIGGALAGAAINHDKRGKGALIGAIGGALLGTAIGAYMDNHRDKLLKELRPEIQAGSIIVEKLPNHSIIVTMSDTTAFDTGSHRIKNNFYPTMNKISNIVNEYGKTSLHVTGHTDNVGSDRVNQPLSTNRALAVRNYLSRQGVANARLSYQGLSSQKPRASNNTEAGRRLNRRVEILITPVEA